MVRAKINFIRVDVLQEIRQFLILRAVLMNSTDERFHEDIPSRINRN